MFRAACTFAILAAVALVACRAHAGELPAADRERLAKLLNDGAAAAGAQRWDACIAAYSAAIKIEKTPQRLGELGACEEAHGRHDVDAYGHLHEALHAPGIDRNVEPYNRFDRALGRVAMRVADVYVSAQPSEAALFIDGKPIDKSDGRTIMLEPGKYVFSAHLDGYKDDSESRELTAGQNTNVYLQLEKLEPVPQPRAPATPHPGAIAWLLARPERIAFAAVTGLAVLTAAASGGTAIGLEVDRASYGSKLTSSSCFSGAASRPPECASAHERAQQRDTSVDVAIGAGIAAGAAAAVTGILFAADRRSPYHPSIAPTASPNGGGIVVVGTF